MFDHLLAGIKRELDSLRDVVDIHERLRNLIWASEGIGSDHEVRQDLLEIAKNAPTKSDWILYDHCAALTRLYAIFENFIENQVIEYLDFLPQLYPLYYDLPIKIRNQHRVGIAQILQKIGKDGLYREILESKVIEGLAAGHSGIQYSLYSKAFLVDPQNYRAEIVNQIFSYLSFDDLWAGVEGHPEVSRFMASRDSNETPRTLLKKLVDDRNVASHTSSSSTWPVDEIKAFAHFIEAVTVAIAQIALKGIVSEATRNDKIQAVGTVIHKYSANVIGIRSAGVAISVGDSIIVSQNSGAFTATIQSIQIVDTSHLFVLPLIGQEIGIALDHPTGSKADLFRIAPVKLSSPLIEEVAEILSPDDYEVPVVSHDSEV